MFPLKCPNCTCFPDEKTDIALPVLMVTPKDGLEIKKQFTYEKGYLALIGGKVDKETTKTSGTLLYVIVIFGIIAVLLGICIFGALVRMLLNLNKK